MPWPPMYSSASCRVTGSQVTVPALRSMMAMSCNPPLRMSPPDRRPAVTGGDAPECTTGTAGLDWKQLRHRTPWILD